ncbi:hypothetical protein J6Z39_03410 [bacterium]|nr:hypothetical protein [bacterium]
MKKFCLVLAMICAFFQLYADDDDKIKLAVMEFEDMSGTIEENILANATEYLRVVFASTNRYIIISKDRQKDTIKDMRKKFNTDPSYKACTDKNCQIQLGQALSADLIVKTTITSFAGSYTLSSELIDLEKEATIIAAKEDYDGSDKALKNAIDKLVEKIVKVETEVNGEIAAQEKPKKQKSKASSSNSKDAAACEYARQKDSSITWKTYIDKYPTGECAEEAKDALDSIACKNAETTNTVRGWKQYLAEFPNGKCEFQAAEAVQQFKAREGGDIYSKADEKLEGLFSGRWNFGLGAGGGFMDGCTGFSFSTGFDFNFKVFSKPYGDGAGNLFLGFGFDFVYYYIPESDYADMVLSLPIMANFAYEFKTRNKILRYVGILFSAGYGNIWDIWGDEDEHYFPGFAWELGMNMIFHNKFTLGLGVGTPWFLPTDFHFNIGTIF